MKSVYPNLEKVADSVAKDTVSKKGIFGTPVRDNSKLKKKRLLKLK